MNADRVIVGEVLGDEVLPMLNAMSQGRSGSMCTIHADSSAGVFRRIASYAVQAAERIPLEASNLLIAGAVHFVVHLDSESQDGYGPASGTSGRAAVDSSLGPSWHPAAQSGFRQLRRASGSSRRSGRWSTLKECRSISNEIFRPGIDRRAVASPRFVRNAHRA